MISIFSIIKIHNIFNAKPPINELTSKPCLPRRSLEGEDGKP